MIWVDGLTVVLFLGAILYIGLIASKRVFNNNDYLLAGNNVSKWPLALSLAATDMGGAGIVGTMALAYTVGISGSFWDICAVPGLFVLAYILPKIFAGRRETTVPELLGKRYDEKTRTLVAILQLVSAAMVISVQNIVTSIVIQTLTGIPFEYALIISAAVFMIYTTAGGMISVIWTDIFAYIVLFLGTLISVLILMFQVGGFSELQAVTPHEYWQYGGLSNMTIGAWILMNTFIYSTSQPYIQRVLAARDQEAVKFAYLFTGINYLLYGILVALLGIFAFALNPSIANAEYGSVQMIYQSLPAGLRSILLVAFLAATMSTGSSYLNGCASIFTIDIYKRLINTSASEVAYLRVARSSTIGIAAISLVMSYVSVGVIDSVVYANLIYSATIFFPLILGYKVEWLSANGAFYAIIGGLIMGGGYALFFHGAEDGMIHPIILAASFSLVILFLVSYMNKMKNKSGL